MALSKAARTAGVFFLSRLRANRLKPSDPGAPRRKRVCPRPLANVPQRGWKRIRASTLSQGISEKRRPAGPISLLFISSMLHYTLKMYHFRKPPFCRGRVGGVLDIYQNLPTPFLAKEGTQP
jgi:hypothetical protein